MQSLQRYEAFLKAAELGSFTRAAEALSYTQSGISRMIADLEREWGVRLLARSRAGVYLTSEGRRLIDQVRRVCTEEQRLEALVAELNDLQTGLIRVGTLSSMATHWLPRIVSAFQKDYPNIEYELLLGDYLEIEQWVLDGRVDCGFLRLPAHAQLQTTFLARDRLLAVLPEGHALAGRERVPLALLAEEPFLLLQKGANDEILRMFRKQGLTPDVRFTTWDDYAIMSMAENGLGVSILPELILRRCPYRIALRELDPPEWRDIGVAVRSQDDLPLAVERFLGYVSASIE
ncbi:MAG TPA: LysR family transcriptional regulator [Candidatus Aphodovivens excrementavium]|nr:LysR family transcriptional regulator [Candidatus Aphodovivens excrementavium]